MVDDPDLSGKKILVIDDENEICDLMQGWLSFLGFEAIIATSGDAGLWKVKTEKPDLIITDVLMPGKTGCELVEHLKHASERIKNIPIIMMSGRASMRDAAGLVDAFVEKPFAPKVMLDEIRRLLKKNKATSC